MINRVNWRRAAALACIIIIGAGMLAFPNASQAAARAALFVMDVVVQPQVSPLRLLSRQPVVESITFPYTGGDGDGMIYWPASRGEHAAVILSPGYLPGLNDPLLDRLAQALARLGLVVLVPRTPNLRQGLLLPEDAEVLIGAFQWLSEQPSVDFHRVGFAGFCVGSSMALVATEDPRISDRVEFVHTFGGYYDARSAFRAIAAHSVHTSDGEIEWQPAPQAVSLFIANVLRHVEDQEERRAIEDAIVTQTQPDIGTLSPLAQQAYQLLTVQNPAEIDAVMASLPVAIQAQFDAVSPAYDITRVKARVFIIHDRSDPYIPPHEAARLAAALPTASQPVLAYYELFNHVRPTRATDWFTLARETGRLVIHLTRVFALVEN